MKNCKNILQLNKKILFNPQKELYKNKARTRGTAMKERVAAEPASSFKKVRVFMFKTSWYSTYSGSATVTYDK